MVWSPGIVFFTLLEMIEIQLHKPQARISGAESKAICAGQLMNWVPWVWCEAGIAFPAPSYQIIFGLCSSKLELKVHPGGAQIHTWFWLRWATTEWICKTLLVWRSVKRRSILAHFVRINHCVAKPLYMHNDLRLRIAGSHDILRIETEFV